MPAESPTLEPSSPDPLLGASVVVVEDDPKSAEILKLYLQESGVDVHVAHDGKTGLALIRDRRPDLVVLDLMLPEMDGWAVCRQVRADSEVPILILSARQEEEDRLLGLGLGADDYVVKPFSPREIVLRTRAILRRVQAARPAGGKAMLGDGPIRIDLDRRIGIAYGREVALTPSEFRLLVAFLRRPGRTFERGELIDHLYPGGGTVVPKAIDVHIGKLRQKIEPEPTEPRHVVTMRGFGYRFEA